MNKIRFEL